MIRQGKGKQIRSRGNQYERRLAAEFRQLGWTECLTSRYASRLHDDCKVDLVNTKPFNVQAKCTNAYGNPLPVLKEMPHDKNYNVVFSKIVNKGEFITMSKRDFYEIISMLKNNVL